MSILATAGAEPSHPPGEPVQAHCVQVGPWPCHPGEVQVAPLATACVVWGAVVVALLARRRRLAVGLFAVAAVTTITIEVLRG